MGLTHFAITSDGSKFDNPRFFIKHQRNLKRKQQKLSKKRKRKVATIVKKQDWQWQKFTPKLPDVAKIFCTNCPYNFIKGNAEIIKKAILPKSRQIIATDCSFIKKSGKATYGIEYFYNGSAGKTEKGLEISVIAVVDVDTTWA